MQTTPMTAAATMPMDVTTEAKAAAKKKEHWLVEVVSGLTVATTMVSALSLWYVFLAYVLPLSS